MIEILESMGLIKKNYQNKNIIILGGISFLFLSLIFLLLFNINLHNIYQRYIYLIMLTSAVGLVDDIVAQNNIKGFKGHFRAFLKGNITTGFFKVIIIFLTAFFVSYGDNLIIRLINTGIIILFANLLNLLDLRPGRAYKIFFLLFIPAIFNKYWQPIFLIFSIIFIITASAELNEKIMLGDGGSNTLGASLGFFYSLNTSIRYKIIIFIILLLFNLLSEYYSFTLVIEKNKYLSFFDHLGRKN